MAFLANPIVILALLLALSSAGNWGLYKLWQGRVAEVGAVSSERDQAIAASVQCSVATDRLAQAAKDREKKLKAAIVVADKKARDAQKRVDATLATMPKFPNDACASAADLSKTKLEERATRLREALEIKP